MSTTSLVEFRTGVAFDCHEFNNSWGGASRIWDSLFTAYIPKQSEYDNWMTAAGDGRLWKVWSDARLSESERLVYWFSCDNAIVRSKDFAAMAAALRDFVVLHPIVGRVCHLEGYAKVFDECQGDAIGLHTTSVCENPWFDWDENKEESVPYNLLTGDKHWYVFDKHREHATSEEANATQS